MRYPPLTSLHMRISYVTPPPVDSHAQRLSIPPGLDVKSYLEGKERQHNDLVATFRRSREGRNFVRKARQQQGLPVQVGIGGRGEGRKGVFSWVGTGAICRVEWGRGQQQHTNSWRGTGTGVGRMEQGYVWRDVCARDTCRPRRSMRGRRTRIV